jgi:hypothetical protein
MPALPTSRDDIERQVAERAAHDPEFRRALIADPSGALKRELGVEVPESVTFTVLEESPTQVYLVLPQGVESGYRLSDEDLEKAAGGDPTYYPSYYGIATCAVIPC